MRNVAFGLGGLAVGSANSIRHRVRGYTTPRPFDPVDVDATLAHSVKVVDRLQELGGLDWHGMRVLEIGPGCDLTSGAIMRHRGAAAYMAVDAFDNRDRAPASIYHRLGDVLGSEVDVDALGFRLATFPGMHELDGEYDLIVSNATLEHIPDISGLFCSLKRLAASSCRMVHHIDGQTHMRWFKERDPLNILRYSDRVYNRFLAFPGAPNRLRADDFRSAADSAGWASARVVNGRTLSREYVARTVVAPRFRDCRDLHVATFTLIAE
jgi:Methyltransferase domain